jgi:CRP/FNR family transcriptional regulator, cyclic AMP receptor protein
MVDKQAAVDLLAGVDLFQGLSKKELRAIAAMAKEMHYEPGRHVVTEGEKGGRFHVIVDGKAKVTVGGRTRNILGPGDYFGEISLIDGGPRSATVTAETPLTTLALAEWHFRPLLKEVPTIAPKVLVEMCRRLRDNEKLLTQ